MSRTESRSTDPSAGDRRVTDEVITPESFTRARALALLEEFSKEEIARWLEGNGVASREHSQVIAGWLGPFDSMGCAITRLMILSMPDGERESWSVSERQFHEISIGYLCALIPEEMRGAGFFEGRVHPYQAIITATKRWRLWYSGFSGTNPPTARPETREELLALIGAHKIMLPIREAGKVVDDAFRLLRRGHRPAKPEDLISDKEEFRAEVSASTLLDSESRVLKLGGEFLLPAKAILRLARKGELKKTKKEVRTTIRSDALVEQLQAPAEVESDLGLIRAVEELAERGRGRGFKIDPALVYLDPDNRDSRKAVATRFGCTEEEIRSAEQWLAREGTHLRKKMGS
jgi:hypothetical protein